MSVPTRPGIRPETLAKAGVIYTDTPEPGSILIPYFDIRGERTSHHRVRLPDWSPTGHKYWQPPDSGYIAWLPPEPLKPSGDLYGVEGEFNGQSLYEEGFQVIAFPGLFCYRSDELDADGGRKLLPELIEAIKIVQPKRFIFIGDADTSHNFEFSRSAHFLGQALQKGGIKVLLPRLPADGPKGIDDFKAAHPDDFATQFKALMEEALVVPPSDSIAALMAVLIENQKANLLKLERGKLEDRLFKVATAAAL